MNDIGMVTFPSIVPVQCPRRAIAVLLSCAVFVTEDVIADHCEHGCNKEENSHNKYSIDYSKMPTKHLGLAFHRPLCPRR